MCSNRVIISCPHGRRAGLRLKSRPSATVPQAPGSRRGAQHLPAHPRGRPGRVLLAREDTISEDTISQIPPNTATAPIRSVG